MFQHVTVRKCLPFFWGGSWRRRGGSVPSNTGRAVPGSLSTSQCANIPLRGHGTREGVVLLAIPDRPLSGWPVLVEAWSVSSVGTGLIATERLELTRGG